MKELLNFPIAKVFPCLDLWRIYLLHAASQLDFNKSDAGAGTTFGTIRFLTDKNAPATVQMLTLRAMCNWFRQ